MKYWKCVKSKDRNFTKEKIYESKDDGYGFVGDDGFVYDTLMHTSFSGVEFQEVYIPVVDLQKPTEQPDAINPSHYNSTKISAFDVIDDWKLDFYSGNVVKYIQRAGKKENNSELQDLKKAQRYLEKKIELLEGK